MSRAERTRLHRLIDAAVDRRRPDRDDLRLGVACIEAARAAAAPGLFGAYRMRQLRRALARLEEAADG